MKLKPKKKIDSTVLGAYGAPPIEEDRHILPKYEIKSAIGYPNNRWEKHTLEVEYVEPPQFGIGFGDWVDSLYIYMEDIIRGQNRDKEIEFVHMLDYKRIKQDEV